MFWFSIYSGKGIFVYILALKNGKWQKIFLLKCLVNCQLVFLQQLKYAKAFEGKLQNISLQFLPTIVKAIKSNIFKELVNVSNIHTKHKPVRSIYI